MNKVRPRSPQNLLAHHAAATCPKVSALYLDLRQKPRPVYNEKGLKQEKDEGAGDMQ